MPIVLLNFNRPQRRSFADTISIHTQWSTDRMYKSTRSSSSAQPTSAANSQTDSFEPGQRRERAEFIVAAVRCARGLVIRRPARGQQVRRRPAGAQRARRLDCVPPMIKCRFCNSTAIIIHDGRAGVAGIFTRHFGNCARGTRNAPYMVEPVGGVWLSPRQ